MRYKESAPPFRKAITKNAFLEKWKGGGKKVGGENIRGGKTRGTYRYHKEKDPGTPWDVFIYYWDKRDGARYSGWWFGSSVGGNQVWARSGNDGPMPPRGGWAIPWNTQPREDFEVTEQEPEGSDYSYAKLPSRSTGPVGNA